MIQRIPRALRPAVAGSLTRSLVLDPSEYRLPATGHYSSLSKIKEASVLHPLFAPQSVLEEKKQNLTRRPYRSAERWPADNLRKSVLEKIEDGYVRSAAQLWCSDEQFVMPNSETLHQLNTMQSTKMSQAVGEPDCCEYIKRAMLETQLMSSRTD
ncbi:hypothetical protein GJ496_005294 [Pomphorhynchus laevis]|nr:hypothetical protein GJ496_005294 [Pomphorhynchus laevis]